MPRPPVIELTGFPVPVYALRRYRPQRRGPQDEFSKNIIALKYDSEEAIKYFANMIMGRLRTKGIPCKPDLIATVPGEGRGLPSVGKRIAPLLKCKFRADVLVPTEIAGSTRRPYDKPTFEERRKSMRLKARIRDKSILLLDDVITSHATMQAALKCILDGHPSVAVAVALGYSGDQQSFA